MRNKYFFIFTISVLIMLLIIGYVYKNNHTSINVPNHPTPESVDDFSVFSESNSHTEIKHLDRYIPIDTTDIYKFLKPSDKFIHNTDMECNCIVKHNEKEYKETFMLKNNVEYSLIDGMSDQALDIKFDFCHPICESFENFVKSGKYDEVKPFNNIHSKFVCLDATQSYQGYESKCACILLKDGKETNSVVEPSYFAGATPDAALQTCYEQCGTSCVQKFLKYFKKNK